MWEHGVPDSRLVVAQQVEDYIRPDGRHEAQYLCKCNCGSDKNVIALKYSIQKGSVKSCGCIVKKYNKYDLSGDYGVGWTSNTNNEFYFDLEDYDKIKDYCWCEIIDNKGYHSLNSKEYDNNKKVIKMNWIIIGKNYDHINRNPLDNRKSNLRKASITENNRNKSLRVNNTSGVIGVCFENDRQKWKAYIMVDGKKARIGSFINKVDAIRARLEAEAKYYGEFAPQRHLFEEYGITAQN